MSPLSLKILGSLFLVFLLTMSAVLIGSWTYQRDKLIGQTQQNALHEAQIIKAGLQSSMLLNNRDSSLNIIKDMIIHANLFRILILNKNGKIVIASDPAMEGVVLDKATDETCLVCHRDAQSMEKAAVVIKKDDAPYLRTVLSITNQPSCYGCHSAAQKITGILVVDSSLSETYEIIRTGATRFLVTGVISFILITILISFIVSRFVSRPMQSVMHGIKKVEQGDFSSWVHVKGKGEFSDMAESFNVMNQAISRYLNEIKEKKTEISTLYNIVRRMNETIEWQKVKEIVSDLLIEILQVEFVVFAVPSENNENSFAITWKNRDDKRHYHAEYQLGSGELPSPYFIGQDIDACMAEEHTDPHYTQNNTKLLLPLYLNTMKLGLICAVKIPNKEFTNADKKFIPVLAQHIATSFANARLYNIATTDALTSLFSKRYFEAKLNDLEQEHLQSGRPFCLMMIDIDHFKQVNDMYGHQVGDKVLTQIAALLKADIRKMDFACRYGGEEFAVLLPEADIATTNIIAERIRQNIAAHVFNIEKQTPFNKTISIGIACYSEHAASGEDLIAAADGALYQAKRLGRNQVITHSA